MQKLLYRKETKLLAETVYEQMLEMLIRNPDLQDHVITEKEMMERFSAGKAAVRDAMVRLCAEGILTNLPRYGYYINPLDDSEAGDLIAIRAEIELRALDLSFDAVRLQHGQDLKNLLTETAVETKDGMYNVWDVWTGNSSFHRELCNFSDNAVLSELLSHTLRTESRFYAMRMWQLHHGFDYRMKDQNSHLEIVQAIIDGDKEKALKLLKEDVLSGNDLFNQ